MKWGYSVINVYGSKKMPKKHFDTINSDTWALNRLTELMKSGVDAKLVRQSKKEPLCVCYSLNSTADRRQ